jgi:hypothetical protein
MHGTQKVGYNQYVRDSESKVYAICKGLRKQGIVSMRGTQKAGYSQYARD